MVSPVPTLPDTERRTTYSVTTTTTGPFDVDFDLYGDGTDYANWIEVYVDGEKQASGWTLDSPSGTLISLSRPITDARVTFDSSLVGTVGTPISVEIVGARRPRGFFNFATVVDPRTLTRVLMDHEATLREGFDKSNGLETRIDATEADIAAHEVRLDADEATISSHGTRLTTAEGNIADLDTRVTQVETDIAEAGTPLFSAIAIDEDDMSSNLATKVPTQQSVKAFVDNKSPANITALKALNGTGRRDGEVLWLCDSATKGRHGGVIYDAGSSVTGDDVVYFTPADSVGRFVRFEWYNHQEIHARWWGWTKDSTAAASANGTAFASLISWIQAQTGSGKCKFPPGQFYISAASAPTLSKKRGWQFIGCGSGGDANSVGTILTLYGGGATELLKLKTVLLSSFQDIRFRLQGSGYQTILNIGAENYYDTDGTTPIDTAAVSSYLIDFERCVFYGDYVGGFAPSRAAIHIHSTVSIKFDSCWIYGVDVALFLGETGTIASDADGRTLAKGAAAQITTVNCLFDGEIAVRKVSGFYGNGGQITRPSGTSGATRGARIFASTLTWANCIKLDGVSMGYGGDSSSTCISASMVIQGLVVTPTCYIAGYSIFASAGGASTNWDVSPTVGDATGMSYVLDINSACTGKNIGSRSDKITGLTGVINDGRTGVQDYRPLVLKASKTFDWASFADGAGDVTTVTVTGAALGDFALASMSVDQQGMMMPAWVSSANTVTVRLQNETGGGPLNLASATLAVIVFKREY